MTYQDQLRRPSIRTCRGCGHLLKWHEHGPCRARTFGRGAHSCGCEKFQPWGSQAEVDEAARRRGWVK